MHACMHASIFCQTAIQCLKSVCKRQRMHLSAAPSRASTLVSSVRFVLFGWRHRASRKYTPLAGRDTVLRKVVRLGSVLSLCSRLSDQKRAPPHKRLRTATLSSTVEGEESIINLSCTVFYTLNQSWLCPCSSADGEFLDASSLYPLF